MQEEYKSKERKIKNYMIIASKDNNLIKEIKKLKEKKYRKEKYIVEGIKIVKEAIEEKVSIELIVMSESFNENIVGMDTYRKIVVTDKIFKELSDVCTPQGILAIINKNTNKKIDYNAEYIMFLDGIQDPGNIGTIIRTLDSANIKQLLVTKDTIEVYNPKVVRSTMGAIFRVNVIEIEDYLQTFKDLRKNGFEIVSTSLDATKSVYDITYNKKVVVIGNEANGVSKLAQENSDFLVKIPMLGKAESLNAAVAASIMIYEYVREKLT